MQLDFLWTKREEVIPTADMVQLDATLQIPIRFQRNHRARRYLLRLRPDGTARVTIPRRGSVREANAFVNEHKDWLRKQFVKWQSRPRVSTEWATGTEFLFRGEMVRLEISSDGKRALFGAEQAAIKNGLPIRKQIIAHLLRLAQSELPGLVVVIAKQLDCAITRVSVRNQRSRWGSCSMRGTISLNWRLVQMPPAVRDYIIVHELMHTKEMNHSRRFWARVAEACPDFAAQERWLKAHGTTLLH